MARRRWTGPGLGWAGSGRPARPGPSIFDMMGRGPARPVKCSVDGPRLGPALQFFREWAAARPGASHFQEFTAWAGPAYHFLKRLGPARPGPSHVNEPHETRALRGPALPMTSMGRPMYCPVLKGACAYADVIF